MIQKEGIDGDCEICTLCEYKEKTASYVNGNARTATLSSMPV